MLLTDDEYKANEKVQNLKIVVDQAEDAVNNNTLASLTNNKLIYLIASVQHSINKRSSLLTLGDEKGHKRRIMIEQSILNSLTSEVERRVKKTPDKLDNANVDDKNLLPKTSTWAG